MEKSYFSEGKQTLKIHWFSRCSPNMQQRNAIRDVSNIAVLLLQHFHFCVKLNHTKAKGTVLSIYAVPITRMPSVAFYFLAITFMPLIRQYEGCLWYVIPTICSKLTYWGLGDFFWCVDMYVYIDIKVRQFLLTRPLKTSYTTALAQDHLLANPRIHRERRILIEEQIHCYLTTPLIFYYFINLGKTFC